MDKVKMIKKGGLLALGLASITTKKAEQMISSLVREGKLNQKQGEALARKVIAETLKEQQRIRKNVVGEVAKSACRVMAVTKQEASRLVKQVKPLKAKPKKVVKKKKKKRK